MTVERFEWIIEDEMRTSNPEVVLFGMRSVLGHKWLLLGRGLIIVSRSYENLRWSWGTFFLPRSRSGGKAKGISIILFLFLRCRIKIRER